MIPDRAEAAAVACEGLAAAAAPDDRHRAHVASTLLSVPLTHPLRWTSHEGRMVDRVLETATAAQHGTATPEELRAFAAELRAGAPEMRARGWYPYVVGGAR